MGTRDVRIAASPLPLEDVAAVAAGARVSLTSEAVARITASRAVVDEAIGRGEAIYGVTTGVGHARDEALPPDALRELQPILVEMHVGGYGALLPPERVRAAMAVRLNGFVRGGAGASLPVVELLTCLLNHGIHPVMPAIASVGAGDLAQLASVGRALLGRGGVEVDGERMTAAEALAASGLEPVSMEPKDALAVISANAVSIGHGALLVPRLRDLLATSDLVAATTMEAMAANPSVVDPSVAGARHSPGQRTASEHIRRALDGSVRTGSTATLSVQDPLSFRVVPQVHGACRNVVAELADRLADELNAASDNPLVDVASRRLISNGNFHPVDVALSAEGLRVALGHVGLLAVRRMGHSWDRAVTMVGTPTAGPPGGGATGPPGPGAGPPPSLVGLALRYPGAGRYTRLRQLAQPVTLDVPTLDLGVEDHSTNLPVALIMVEEAMGIVEELLASELLTAVALLGLDGGLGEGLGRGTGRLLGEVASLLDELPTGSSPGDAHEEVSALLRARTGGAGG